MVFAHSTVSGTFNQARTVSVTIPSSQPRMAVEVPADRATVGAGLHGVRLGDRSGVIERAGRRLSRHVGLSDCEVRRSHHGRARSRWAGLRRHQPSRRRRSVREPDSRTRAIASRRDAAVRRSTGWSSTATAPLRALQPVTLRRRHRGGHRLESGDGDGHSRHRRDNHGSVVHNCGLGNRSRRADRHGRRDPCISGRFQ